MAYEPPSSVYEQKLELMGSIENPSFSPRIARFLNPVATTLTEAAPVFKPTKHSTPFFKGWNHPPTKWAEWVDQMAGKYSCVWMKAGIFDSILSSIYEITCNHDLISALLHFWNPKTNTFVFPWGEATVTLEDVMILGRFSVLGDSVVHGISLTADLGDKVEVMNRFRSELIRSKSKKASHSKWIQMFMANDNEHEHEHEHVGFLSLWLSRFVFPSSDRDSVGKHVIPIAVKLSQGVKLALAPVILASIYHYLTKLKEQPVGSSTSSVSVNLLGPFQLVQIWVYERLPIVGPRTPNQLRPGEPRLARWHGLSLNSDVGVCVPLLHSHLINHENFIWRPYAVDLNNWQQPLYYQDSEKIIVSELSKLDDDLQSFVWCLQPCELNGFSYKAKYQPHRVAMQFGFDQDIPDDLSSYKVSSFVKFLVPSRSFQAGVSMRYSDWWKNLDPKKHRSNQDSSLGKRMNATAGSKRYVQENSDNICDLDDEIDDILMGLKKICNATKRKIDSLKKSYVGVPQSKKRRLGSEFGAVPIDVIQID